MSEGSYSLRGSVQRVDGLGRDTAARSGASGEQLSADVLRLRENLFGTDPQEVRQLAPSSARRASGDALQEVEVKADDVLQVELRSGFKLWIRGDDFRDEFLAESPVSRSRGGGGNSNIAVFDLPETIGERIAARGATDESSGAEAIRNIKVFKLAAAKVGGIAGEIAARHLAKLYEDHSLKDSLNQSPDSNACSGRLWLCSLENEFTLTCLKSDDEAGNVKSEEKNKEKMTGKVAEKVAEKVTDKVTDKDKPWLLFIHGTASSTEGSFGGLWKEEANRPYLQRLKNRYGTKCLAFEHRTLTKSPIENARDLVAALKDILPEDAQLHLVSHSRGGMVGELLCRIGRVRLDNATWVSEAAFDSIDEELFQDVSAKPVSDSAQATLKDLNQNLQASRWKIDRFVRVACPALGTTLASGRLDRWLSALLACVEKGAAFSPGVVETSAALLTEFLKAVVKQRMNPAELPGLAAMTPGSPVVKLLNRPEVHVDADLSIIAGDSQAKGLGLGRLNLLFLDLFYGGEHDWVVNTGSMYGGMCRINRAEFKKQESQAVFRFETAPEVWHFSYFRRQASVRALVDRLTESSAASAGFARLNPSRVQEPSRGIAVDVYRLATDSGELKHETAAADVKGERPVVIVLPGIMGSHLKDRFGRVWADPWQLSNGGMSRIRIKEETKEEEVKAEAIHVASYGALVDFLSRSHDVVPFEYDWRLSLKDAGEGLNTFLRDEIWPKVGNKQPVRFVAHSMGGLVLASMMRHENSYWKKICEHPGAHAVLLGSPLGGSYSVVEALFGMGIVDQIAMLDQKGGRDAVLKIVSEYCGMLELLPQLALSTNATDPDDIRLTDSKGVLDPRDYFSNESWTSITERWVKEDTWRNRITNFGFSRVAMAPSTDELAKAKTVVNLLSTLQWDATRVTYIRGQAKETPAALVDKSNKLSLRVTPEGDGRVLWRLPKNARHLPQWLMPNVVHGDMANAKAFFPSILNLLVTGGRAGSGNLVSVAPAAASAATRGTRPTDDSLALAEHTFQPSTPFFPTPEIFQRLVAGGSLPAVPGAKRHQRADLPTVRVQVAHGNLAFARHPIAVGHYYGDPICGPEKDLDRLFNGQLSRQQALALYPGNLRTSEVFLRTSRDEGNLLEAAIVVGLGEAGFLSGRALENTFARAVIDFALKMSTIAARDNDSRQQLAAAQDPTSEQTDGNSELHFTVGEQYLSLSTLLIGTGADGLTIRESVQAIINAVLSANEQLARIAASDSGPVRLIRDLEFIELFEDAALEAKKQLNDLANQRWRRSRLEFDGVLHIREGGLKRLRRGDSPGWWHRLEITSAPAGRLKYVSLTKRAGAPEYRVLPQRRAINRLVKDVIQTVSSQSDDFRSAAQTLFEMLVPNSLKEQAEDSTSLVLLLDETTAAIPWEVITDRTSRVQQPLSVACGMLRHLRLREVRPRQIPAIHRKALVIGNPDTPFAQLPGAELEARVVSQVLHQCGFDVTESIGTSGVDIFRALHADQYRVLHLAGHGVHRFNYSEWQRLQPKTTEEQQATERRDQQDHCCQLLDDDSSPKCCGKCDDDLCCVSGMVLGNDLFLTAADVEQMRVTPELVFINCCHLGATERDGDGAGGTGGDRTLQPDAAWHEFAANIAVQFMRMGVRCVVAAGWAVDDAAGQTFAREFYESITSGRTFGEAVQSARSSTFAEHPDRNTFGAYQCYGDPGWRLAATGMDYGGSDGDGGSTATRRSSPNGDDPAFCPDLRELLCDIRNIRARAEVTSVRDATRLRERLRGLEINSQNSQAKDNPEISAALGLAWSELGDFQKGEKLLEKATQNGIGRLPLEVFDRWFECRNRNAQEPAIKDARARLVANVKRIGKLLELAPSIDRQVLLGSAHKRLAMLDREKSNPSDKSLASMCEAFKDAVDLSRTQTVIIRTEKSSGLTAHQDWSAKSYPTFCLHTGNVVRSLRTGQLVPGLDIKEIQRWCDELEPRAKSNNELEPNFWDSAWSGGLPLLRLLISHLEKTPTKKEPLKTLNGKRERLKDSVIAGYRQAMRRGASPRNRISILQHLEFIETMLRDHSLGEPLRQIQLAIREEM